MYSNRTITCQSLGELIDVCARLTAQGCAFEAETGSLTINITGY